MFRKRLLLCPQGGSHPLIKLTVHADWWSGRGRSMRAFEGATPSRTAIGGTNDKARAVIGDKDKVVGAKWDSHPLTRGDSIFASPGWIVMGNVMSSVDVE